MKSKPHPTLTQIFGRTLAVAALSACLSGWAQSGTWTNAVDLPDNYWSEPTNWLNNVVATGAGNTAVFSNELTAAVTVNLDTPRSIGNLDFQLGTYTITNNGADSVNILTLEGPSKPVIYVGASGTPSTIRRTVLAGTNGFVLDGGGQLNLFKENSDSNNVITGDLVFSNGTIQVQGVTADNDNFANTIGLGSITSFTFYNGTLNMQPAVNTSPEYGNVNGNLIVPAGGVGTIVLPVRFSGASGDNSAGLGSGLGGSLTGSGTLNVRSRYVRGNVVGDWSAFTGLIDIGPSSANADNSFRFGNPMNFTNASVNFSGTTPLGIVYYRSLTANTNIPIGVLSGDNPLTALVGSASAAFTLFFDVGYKHTSAANSATYAGSIVNGAGPAGLIKRGAGTLILTGPNTYTGPTIISNGVLQVGDGATDSGTLGSGLVTNLSALVFARAGTFTVPGSVRGNGPITNSTGTTILAGANLYSGPTRITAGKLTLGTASVLTNVITVADGATLGALVTAPNGRVTVNNTTFGTGCAFDFDLQTFGNPSGTVVTNTGTVTLTGNVSVNVAGSGFSVGTITLLRYTARSGAGNFVLGTLPSQLVATLNDDTVNKQVTLTITALPPDATLRYVGDGNGVWDIGNLVNQIWVETFSSAVTNYYDGAPVRFDDTATGTRNINVSTTVSPSSIVVSNSSATNYTFSGGGTISGNTGLKKEGTSTLTMLTTADAYIGVIDIQGGTLAIGDGVNAGSIGTGPITNNGTLLLNSSAPVTVPGAMSGPGTIRQIGSGMATISGANTHTGGLTVSNSSIALNSGAAGGTGGNIVVQDSSVSVGATIQGGNAWIILNSAVVGLNTANRQIDGPIRGTNALLNFDKTALMTLNGNLSGFFGTISNSGTGLLRFNSGGGNTCFGSSNALFILSAGSFLQNRNGGNIDLGALEGSGTIGSPQNANNATVNFLIGGLNTSTTFEGTINDNNTNSNNRLTGISKVGTGTLTCSNCILTYFGPTIVSNGTLRLAGSGFPSNSTAITVVSPGILNVADLDAGALRLGESTQFTPSRVQTLRGNGNITGNVVLTTFGRLEPGFSVGALTVSGSVTLGGTNVFELDRTNTPSSDRLTAASIAYGGRLIVTNFGNTLVGGEVFTLFSSSALSGSFTSVTLPPLGTGLSWNDTLAANGQISVVGSITPPQILNLGVVGTNLTFSGSNGVPNSVYRLLASTNVAAPLATWTVLSTTNRFDANGGFSIATPMVPGVPERFYRVQLP